MIDEIMEKIKTLVDDAYQEGYKAGFRESKTLAEYLNNKKIEAIKTDVIKFESDCEFAVAGDNEDCLKCVHGIFGTFYHIIDKHIGKENECDT